MSRLALGRSIPEGLCKKVEIEFSRIKEGRQDGDASVTHLNDQPTAIFELCDIGAEEGGVEAVAQISKLGEVRLPARNVVVGFSSDQLALVEEEAVFIVDGVGLRLVRKLSQRHLRTKHETPLEALPLVLDERAWLSAFRMALSGSGLQ